VSTYSFDLRRLRGRGSSGAVVSNDQCLFGVVGLNYHLRQALEGSPHRTRNLTGPRGPQLVVDAKVVTATATTLCCPLVGIHRWDLCGFPPPLETSSGKGIFSSFDYSGQQRGRAVGLKWIVQCDCRRLPGDATGQVRNVASHQQYETDANIVLPLPVDQSEPGGQCAFNFPDKRRVVDSRAVRDRFPRRRRGSAVSTFRVNKLLKDLWGPSSFESCGGPRSRALSQVIVEAHDAEEALVVAYTLHRNSPVLGSP